MKYRLHQRLAAFPEDTDLQDGEYLVQIVNEKEFQEQRGQTLEGKRLLGSMRNFQYCKAELLMNFALGTFVVPKKENLLEKETCYGFYMDREKLIFVDNGHQAEKILDEMVENQYMDQEHIPHVLFTFMEFLVNQDVPYLQKFEEQMSKMEEEMLHGRERGLTERLMRLRRGLLRLGAYYNQLLDMSETLCDNYNKMLDEEECSLFKLFSDRVSRLIGNVQNLKEYSIQIQEMYETQNEIKQNHVMQFLTVVTTLFMPLTLLTGWYGMNFAGMKELTSPWGYPAVIGISVLLVLLELLYFKRKKWL